MKIREFSQYTLLQPQCRLDTQGSLDIKEFLMSSKLENQKPWVLDMTEVEFIDSSGLGALVTLLKAARRQGSRLLIYRPSATAQLIFEITQLDRVFEVVNDLEGLFLPIDQRIPA